MKPIDAGHGILLVPASVDRAEEIFAVVDANRDHLRPWMPWVSTTAAPSDTLEFLEGAVADAEARRSAVFLIRDDQGLLGTVGMHGISWLNRAAEIGYWLRREACGRGVMTRAVCAVVEFAFGELDLHRVEIRCAPENRPSRAIPERLGFPQEAVLREAGRLDDGRFVDLVVYRMLAGEWHPPSLNS